MGEAINTHWAQPADHHFHFSLSFQSNGHFSLLKQFRPLSFAKYQCLFGICALCPCLGIGTNTILAKVNEQQVMALPI